MAILLCILADCSTRTKRGNGNFGHIPEMNVSQPRESASNQILQVQFTDAHAIADSIVKIVIDDTSAYKCLITDYGFSYPYWVKSLNDTLSGPALEYKFYYGLLFEGDTIKYANISVGSDMRINYCDINELIAYKKFLNGELEIGPKQALAEAIPFGIKDVDVSTIFHSSNFSIDTLPNIQCARKAYDKALANPGNFFWEIRNTCNGCVWLKVDASNGVVFDQGRVMYQY